MADERSLIVANITQTITMAQLIKSRGWKRSRRKDAKGRVKVLYTHTSGETAYSLENARDKQIAMDRNVV